MKIGIVTITELENFGNRLQNYALQETLKSLGVEVETLHNYISYKHRKSKKWQLSQLVFGLKHRSRGVIAELYKIKRFERFDKNHFVFSKYFSELNYIPEKLGEQFDYFVAGSDQIWNPNFPFNLDFNFLTFCEKNKRISYSGSFGVDSIPEEYQERYINYLNGFSRLTVREYTGQRIVNELIGENARVVVDPTLLLNQESWRLFSKKPHWLKMKRYVLVYFLGETNTLQELQDSLGDEFSNLEIINIHDKHLIIPYAITPDEFIWLIDNADLVITDSFHGTVFSILMETPFIHSLRKGGLNMSSRVDSLFRLVGLEYHEGMYKDHINNDSLKKKITERKQESLQFLSSELSINNEKG